MIRHIGWWFAAAAVVAVFVDHPWAPAVAVVLAVAAALAVDRQVLAVAFRFGVVMTLLLSSALAGAVVMWSEDWSAGVAVASAMLLRLIVLVVVAGLLARNVDAEAILRAGERAGMERLGLVLGLSLNVFPQLADSTRQVVLAWRVRRRSTKVAPPSPLQLMEVLLAHVARIADEAAAAAALRGHSALVHAPVAVTGSTLVVVATGKPGSGKTTAVQRLVDTLRSRGYSVRGILQPGRFEEGSKTGFAIHDLDTGEEADLAGLVERGEGDHGTRFRFAADGFALAEHALAKVQSGDILVVDELGPLELRGQGHSRAVQRALQVPGLAGIVLVVRSQLVPALLANLRVDDAAVVDVAAQGSGERLLDILTNRP